MVKVLVTGVGGFVGQHLVKELHDQEHEVSGITHSEKLDDGLKSLMKQHTVCDLTDSKAVNKLDLSSYNSIINLAGLSNVGESFKQPGLYISTNVDVLNNLCQAMVRQRSNSRILAISTGAIYDPVQPMPLNETSRTITDGSPYAKSKLLMEKVALKYIEQGLDCIIARPFNHVGPGQRAGFLMYDLCHQLLDNNSKIIRVGNMLSKRDYTDVRDVVAAYMLIATSDKTSLTSSIYNVCSGISRSGQEILDELRKNIPGSLDIKIDVDPNLIRPNDPEELVGSHDLLSRDTGWQPNIPFEQTVQDIIESVKKQLST